MNTQFACKIIAETVQEFAKFRVRTAPSNKHHNRIDTEPAMYKYLSFFEICKSKITTASWYLFRLQGKGWWREKYGQFGKYGISRWRWRYDKGCFSLFSDVYSKWSYSQLPTSSFFPTPCAQITTVNATRKNHEASWVIKRW